MDSRHLEYFVAAAEELHFTRAARRCYVVQSTLSVGITTLERQLGAPLFDRQGRGVALTRMGHELLPLARTALESLSRFEDASRNDGLLRGRVRLGTFAGLGVFGMPEMLGDFHRQHPGVELLLTPSPSGSLGLADDVRHGRLDLCLYGLPDTPPGLQRTELASSEFVAILPSVHPLATSSRVLLADLMDEAFVEGRAGFGNRLMLDAELERRHLRRRISIEVADLLEVPQFVAAGFGVGVLPALTVQLFPGSVSRPLDISITWPLSLLTTNHRSVPTDALIERLVASFRHHSGA